MLESNLGEILKEVGVSAVVVDHSGRILEISEGWTRPGVAGGAVKPGKSYFETCIRPDRHSLELLRGFKNLAENSIDFFATVSWREEAGERKYFLIAATPRTEHDGTILVLHIDLSVLLRGRRELSTLMIGQGPAAFAQMEAAMLGVVRGAITEALGASNGRGTKTATIIHGTDDRVIDDLTRPQIELLSYLANGLSNQQIAKERGMSINTVKSQVANVIQKLNVANRTQAALFAVRNSNALGLQIQA
uniref:Transcriptional regulator, LuxR family n=1 Tax=Rhodopseudomonas palustris (strain BisA53) TaxID=316055 RepID=Q07I17_RHOP5